ncbi:MAG TPA: hypothetical protein VHB20_00375 [Verrucomicrobiae bacterium]|jgi:hypothetical protein|nr:hypothetical protein [Verrucomicrobiae bacterium]
MSSEENQAWEARLDRALKELPELPAPGGLVDRTMAALETRPKSAWHQQPWTAWPLWLRAVSLSGMLAVIGALATIKWNWARALGEMILPPSWQAPLAKWDVLWETIDTLGRAACALARHADGWVTALAVVAAVMAYLACIGLGTLAARLTAARS